VENSCVFARSGVKSCHATFSLHKSDGTGVGKEKQRSFGCAHCAGADEKRAKNAKNKKSFNNSPRLFFLRLERVDGVIHTRSENLFAQNKQLRVAKVYFLTV
jgi:hypothetical protein